MGESEPLALRCNRRANAAITGTVCDVVLRSRSPLVVDIRDVAGQPPLTPAQHAAAKAAAEATSTAPRTPRAVTALAAEIETWIGVDVTRLRKVAALALALELARDPTLCRRHGIPVDGDS